jgi:hypothetical protein
VRLLPGHGCSFVDNLIERALSLSPPYYLRIACIVKKFFCPGIGVYEIKVILLTFAASIQKT